MRIHISGLSLFWLTLIVIFTASTLLIWLWIIPNGILEYNFAVNLLTSSIFMVLTIVFLNVLLDAREKREWKSVEDYVNLHIQEEIGMLFMEILEYVENGLAVKSAMLFQDNETADEIALSELRKLNDAKELKLDETRLAMLSRDESELRFFQEVAENLSEIQIKYSRFLPPQLILSLMKIRDSIRLLGYTVLMQTRSKNLDTYMNTTIVAEKNIHRITSELFPELVSSSFKNIVSQIYGIHEMGIKLCSPHL